MVLRIEVVEVGKPDDGPETDKCEGVKCERVTSRPEFFNESEREFTDISSELFRVYEYGYDKVEIESPLLLSVSESGNHYVFDADGVSHCLPTGWHHLWWKTRPGAPHFVF